MLRKTGKDIPEFIFERSRMWRDEQTQKIAAATSMVDTTGEYAACPVCGKSALRAHVSVFSLDYLECLGCRHIFCRQTFSTESLGMVYESYNTYLPEDTSLFRKRVASFAVPKVDFVLSSIGQKKGLWVDLGCGPGEILYEAMNRGWEVLGVEPSKVAWQNCQKNCIDSVNEYLTDKNAGQFVGKASVVSLFSVIEHVNDPDKLIATISKNMCNGSFLVVKVPRTPSLSAFSIMGTPSAVARHLAPPFHLRIYSEESLSMSLAKCGITMKAIWTFGQDYFELLSTVAYNENIPLDYWPELPSSASKVQKAIDESGLSDSMLVVGVKE